MPVSDTVPIPKSKQHSSQSHSKLQTLNTKFTSSIGSRRWKEAPQLQLAKVLSGKIFKYIISLGAVNGLCLARASTQIYLEIDATLLMSKPLFSMD